MKMRYCLLLIILLVAPSLYASEIENLRDDLQLAKQCMDDMQYDQAIVPLKRVKQTIKVYLEDSSRLPPDYASMERQADEYLRAIILSAEKTLKDEAERLKRELARYSLPWLFFPKTENKNLYINYSDSYEPDYSYLEELSGIKISNQDKTERWAPLTELPGYFELVSSSKSVADYVNSRQNYFDRWINRNEFVKFSKIYPQGELSQHLSNITHNVNRICSTDKIPTVQKFKESADDSFKHISDLIELSKHWSEPSRENMWLQLEEDGTVSIHHRSHFGNRVNIESQRWYLKLIQKEYSVSIEFLENLSVLSEKVEFELKTGNEIDRLLENQRTLWLTTGGTLITARELYPDSSKIDESGVEAFDAVVKSAFDLKYKYQSFYDTYLKENQIEKARNVFEVVKEFIERERDQIQDINLVIQQTNRLYKALLDTSKQAQIQMHRADDCIRNLQLKANQDKLPEDKKQTAVGTVATEKKIKVLETPPADDDKKTDIADQASKNNDKVPTGDVSGGIRIVGKDSLAVGEEALYKVEDYGGNPFSEAKWNTLRENLRMFANGSVMALAAGEAMIMVRSDGMTAFKTIKVVEKTENMLLQDQPDAEYSNIASVPPTDGDAKGNMEWDGDQGDQNEETEGFRSLGGKTETVSHSIEGATLDKQQEGKSDGFASLGGKTEKLIEKDASAADQLEGENLVDDGDFSSIGGDTKIVTQNTEDEHGEDKQKTQSGGFGSKGENLELLGVSPYEDVGQAQISLNSDRLSENNVSEGLSRDSTMLGNDEFALPAYLSDEWVKSEQGQMFGGGEQPAAYHIFAACSRLGWAAGLSRYTVGNADRDIIEHLTTAGEHIMWANRTSYPPNPAWPDWSQLQSKYELLAGDLANNPTETYRKQLANRLSTSYEPLAQELDVQMIGETYSTTTCDGQYCRIGYQLAYGQQSLAVAEEALANGYATLASQASQDGKNHVAAARKSMAVMDDIVPSSGRCAELSDIRQELFIATQANTPGEGRRIAQQQWLETLQRIQALDTQIASSGGDLIGTWYNEKTGQKIVFEEKDGYVVGIINNAEISRFKMTGNNQYIGRALVTERSGDSSRSEWNDGATIKVIGDKAYLNIGRNNLNLVRNLHQNPKVTEYKESQENPKTKSGDNITGTWQFGRIDQNAQRVFGIYQDMEISIVQQGDTFKVVNCSFGTSNNAWGVFRKEGNSYLGQAVFWIGFPSPITGESLWSTTDQANIARVERCLSTPGCAPKVDRQYWNKIEIIPQEKNASVTITGVQYPYDRYTTQTQLLRIE
ncbi:MAG: hypothetical protein JW786_02195 [Desulfobacterales bacterium]|nr:hypothetical protein [Desulfobacterales bacterium]